MMIESKKKLKKKMQESCDFLFQYITIGMMQECFHIIYDLPLQNFFSANKFQNIQLRSKK